MKLPFVHHLHMLYVCNFYLTCTGRKFVDHRQNLFEWSASVSQARISQALFFLPYPTWFKLILYDLLGFQTPNSPDNPLFSSYSDLLCISQKPYRSQVVEEPGE